MRGSSLTTFLMFLPLIAIPLLAIFGVPEFTPVNASTPRDSGGTTAIALDGPVRGGGAAPEACRASSNGDIFAPVQPESSAAPGFPKSSLKPEADPFLNGGPNDADERQSDKRGLSGWELQQRRNNNRTVGRAETSIRDERPGRASGPTGSAAMQSVASIADAPPAGFTWQKAVRTLNRMGVKDFLLQPGSRTDEFHFSCVYASRDNPRIAHRFEAEDADPLLAVQKVLKQIQSQP